MHAIQEDKDCLRCKHLPCVNLYEIVEQENEVWLGDIRMLEKFSKPFKNRLHPPCLLGVAIHVLCKLLEALWETHEEEVKDRKKMLPSTPLYLQGIRDLKATILLILMGHYRAAGAIMRSALELYLSGLYFDYRYLKAQDDEKNEIFNEVRQFVETGEYVIPEKYKRYCEPKRECDIPK